MSKQRFLVWTLIAWPLPALIAGALGWEGIWGSGSALLDYLIPIPVAGGSLHVPSFLFCGLAVARMPSMAGVQASRMRAALVGITLVGVMWLLDLSEILLARQTHSTVVGSLWQENPLGLFLACDGALGLAFSVVRAELPLFRVDALTVALALLPCALPLAMAWPQSSSEQPFRHGTSKAGETRGDETYFVYTRLGPHDGGFRQAALAWVSAPSEVMHPRYHIDNEDSAIMFSEDLNAADRGDEMRVAVTLCLYEDGTEPQWFEGAGDCFRRHVTFSERLRKAFEARPADEPSEVRSYLAGRDLCRKVVAPQAQPEQGTEIMSVRYCSGLARTHEELLRRYPDEARLRDPA
jgi:hypothetical protein